jgi:hypothetical protein
MVKLQTSSGGCAAGAPQTPINPAFIRIPRPGCRDPFCGLTRTALFTLIKQGKVSSVSLKQPGGKRGIRLIDAMSLVEALRKEGA